jgi:hypothetical protein
MEINQLHKSLKSMLHTYMLLSGAEEAAQVRIKETKQKGVVKKV